MIIRFVFPFVISIVMIGCAEMDMDFTTAIKVQERIMIDNKDANDSVKCLVDFDKDIEFINGELRKTIVVEVDQNCIQEVAKKKLEDSEED